MNKRIIFLASISFLIFSFIPNLEASENNLMIWLQTKKAEATMYHNKKDYAKALEIFEQMVQRLEATELKYERMEIFFDLACNYSLIGKKDRALDALNKAVEFGYGDAEHLGNDKDFDNIRNEKDFQEILSALRKEHLFWENLAINTAYRLDISENEKIAGLSKLWSEIKFNFVNFDFVPDVDWDGLYMEYLPKVRQSKSTFEYYLLLQEMCMRLKDGHTGIVFPKELRKKIHGRVPLQTRLIEGKVLVTQVYDEKLRQDGLYPGLEIIKVNGIDAKSYAEQYVRPYWTSNSEQGRIRTIFEYAFLRGPVGEPVELTFQDKKGNVYSKSIMRVSRIPSSRKWVEFRILDHNIGCIDIRSFYGDDILHDFEEIFPQIQKTDALIIDLRSNGGGNGRIGWAILGYFTDKPYQIFRWRTRLYRPIWRAWGNREEVYEQSPAIRFADGSNYYQNPVVILTRDRTASMAENFCMGFQIMKRGIIIGGPTAGSSGTPLVFSLPGGGYGKVVTTRGSYPDGRELTGVGVQPDIVVKLTIEDVREGRDPILETAIDHLKKQIKGDEVKGDVP